MYERILDMERVNFESEEITSLKNFKSLTSFSKYRLRHLGYSMYKMDLTIIIWYKYRY